MSSCYASQGGGKRKISYNASQARKRKIAHGPTIIIYKTITDKRNIKITESTKRQINGNLNQYQYPTSDNSMNSRKSKSYRTIPLAGLLYEKETTFVTHSNLSTLAKKKQSQNYLPTSVIRILKLYLDERIIISL